MTRALLFAMMLAACDSGLDQRLAIVSEPRLLAIVAEPAEAKPGATVAYTAVVATPGGPIDAMPDWAYCTAPKPPTEDNAVADGCLGDEVSELGVAASITATLPSDGCLRYGPDTPPGNFRPRAADPSGGYYQPIRAVAGELVGFGLSRITCDLPFAPGDVAHDYSLDYRANANPTLDPLVLDDVTGGSDVELVASWPAASAESYLYFDPTTQQLVTRRESMRVSWFATTGAIDVDATAVGEDDDATSVSTTWHVPAQPGAATVWLVLRDSRGGIATQTIAVTIH
jgi:hypothetical protein